MLSLCSLKSSTVAATRSIPSSSNQLLVSTCQLLLPPLSAAAGPAKNSPLAAAGAGDGVGGTPISTSPSPSGPSSECCLLARSSPGVIARLCALCPRHCRCRFNMSMTESTVQKVPVRPHPAEQCTSMGRAWASGSGSSGRRTSVKNDACITLASSTSARRCEGCAGVPKSGHEG